MAVSQLRSAALAAVLCLPGSLAAVPIGADAALGMHDGGARTLMDTGTTSLSALGAWLATFGDPPPAEEPETVAEEPETIAEQPEEVTEAPEPADTPVTTPPPSGDLVWGYDTTAPDPNWSRPGLYESYVDVAYGTTVTRVTDASDTRWHRNKYSRHQAESSDGKYFMSWHGDDGYRIYERTTGNLKLPLPLHSRSEPQWVRDKPSVMRYVEGDQPGRRGLKLFEIDVETGESAVVGDFTERIQAVLPGAEYAIDRSEASPSADSNRYCWFVRDSSDEVLGLMTYDVAADEVLGVLPVSDWPAPDAGDMDALSMSPTGKFAITQQSQATYVYDADLSNPRLVFAGAEHSDIAIGANGNDAYVYIDFTGSSNGGWLMSVDLDTLEEARLFNIYDGTLTSLHVSGKGYNKPGWALISTYNCRDSGGWACDKVFAVELKPDGRVLNLAHTYNCGQDYWTETHAVVNRDFTRVYFNTDSGSCGIDAEVMMIDVPPFS